jgi:hypothetical protein
LSRGKQLEQQALLPSLRTFEAQVRETRTIRRVSRFNPEKFKLSFGFPKNWAKWPLYITEKLMINHGKD